MNEGLPDDTVYAKELAARNYNKQHTDGKPKKLNPEMERYSDEDLQKEIAKCHDYRFIGKTGQFCPIKANCGGGLLVREDSRGYSFTSGAKGYRWLESEDVKNEGREADIDISFYHNLVNDSIDTISKYGDFEWFRQ